MDCEASLSFSDANTDDPVSGAAVGHDSNIAKQRGLTYTHCVLLDAIAVVLGCFWSHVGRLPSAAATHTTLLIYIRTINVSKLRDKSTYQEVSPVHQSQRRRENKLVKTSFRHPSET